MGPVDNACHTGPRPVWRIIDGCPIALLLFSIPGRYWPHGLTISTIWHRKVRVRPNRYEPIFAIFARGQFQNSFDWSACAQRSLTLCIFIHDVVHFHTRLYSRSRVSMHFCMVRMQMQALDIRKCILHCAPPFEYCSFWFISISSARTFPCHIVDIGSPWGQYPTRILNWEAKKKYS